jgi:hypothetical protein
MLLQSSIISTLYCDKWFASRPGQITLKEGAPIKKLCRRLIESRNRSDSFGKENVSLAHLRDDEYLVSGKTLNIHFFVTAEDT